MHKYLIFFSLFIINSTLYAQIVSHQYPKGITVVGNTFTFGPMSETQLNQKPIVPTIIKNRHLDKEFLCMKFFNNQIRNRKGVIKLSEDGNFLYAKFNWVHQGKNKKNKVEVINKKLYYDPEKKCHYIGSYPKHELYKVDDKKIPAYEAKDIQIVAYSSKDGGLSVNMGKDPSLVKECKIREPYQDESYYKYNQAPSIKEGYINCQARFRCHRATTAIKFDEIKVASEPLNFEFSGYCLTKKKGKYTCAKVHPDECADAYVSNVLHRENKSNKKKQRPSRFKNKKGKNKGGSGAQM